ncbi:sialic acid-binding Ig-like lectin 8 [Colossoma macropomum]|uniref:sialic acid-binding Ig-like lectin 8 n=1 Tax=Colossoma macropomum TaxID=42526 RepID=UPI001863C7E0|nr:sialic acid-binding Ig-like lectin 8 [Colossoma macropomum]
MRTQITVYVLLLMLLQKATCHEKPEIYVPSLTDGEQATLNCSAPAPCPRAQSQITWRVRKMGRNITSLCIDSATMIVTPGNGTITLMLTFTPSFELHDADVECVVNCGNITTNTNKTLVVQYIKNPRITVNATVKEGATISLNCSAESHPPSLKISWSFGRTRVEPKNKTVQEILIITNVSSEDVGEYVCEVQHFNKNLTTSINITLNSHSVGPTGKNDGQKDQNSQVAHSDDNKVTLRTILAFLVGAASTAIIVCVVLCCVCMCQRCRTLKATDGNANIKLETVKIQQSQADADNVGANEQTPLQKRRSEEAKSTGSGELEEEDTPREDRNLGLDEAAGEEATKEVDYACIDYSLLQKRQAEAQKPKSEDTEYAEIQIKKQAEGEGDELLQDGMDQSASRLEEGVESQEQEGEVEVEVEV